MQSNVKEVLEVIFEVKKTEPLICLACQDALDAYIETELDGKDATARFAHVEAHLDDCSDCQALYEDMNSLLLMAREGRLSELPIEPKFDFSYLKRTSQLDSIWKIAHRAGKEVTELFTELRIVLSQGQAFFEQLPNPLVAEWEVVPMGRMSSRKGTSNSQVPFLSLPSPEHDLSLRLTVIPSESEEQQATLSIEVTKISSGELVNRARVTIRDAQYRTLESDFTRQEGRVDFTDVLPGSYVIEVKYQGKVRQLPITIQ